MCWWKNINTKQQRGIGHMKTLCIIPCGKRKIWDKDPFAGPTEAKNVYIGAFAKKCRQYAETFYPSSWRILSAKYGFLSPDNIIPEDYNATFNKRSSGPISAKKLRYQIRKKGLYRYSKIVMLGGKHYREILQKVFTDKEICHPLSDCKGLGFMMQKLTRSIEEGVSLEA